MLLPLSGVCASMSAYSMLTLMRIFELGTTVKFDVIAARRFVSSSTFRLGSVGKFCSGANGPFSVDKRPDTKYVKSSEPPETEAL